MIEIDCAKHGKGPARCIHPRLGIWDCSKCVDERPPIVTITTMRLHAVPKESLILWPMGVR